MAFKLMVLACVLAVCHGSFIHGPKFHHGGPSTVQYETEEVHYGSNTASSQAEQSSSNQAENSIIRRPVQVISRGQLVPSQQKTVQVSPTGSYAFTGQEKSEIRVTNPGTYATNNYHSSPSAAPAIHHQQVIEYASTPGYNNRNVNGYDHAVSTLYHHPTSGYQTYSHNTGDLYGGQQAVRPVYRYVPSGYGLDNGVGASYTHNGNAYAAHVQPSAPTGAPYSSAAAVSHMSFNSPAGASYNW